MRVRDAYQIRVWQSGIFLRMEAAKVADTDHCGSDQGGAVPRRHSAPLALRAIVLAHLQRCTADDCKTLHPRSKTVRATRSTGLPTATRASCRRPAAAPTDHQYPWLGFVNRKPAAKCAWPYSTARAGRLGGIRLQSIAHVDSDNLLSGFIHRYPLLMEIAAAALALAFGAFLLPLCIFYYRLRRLGPLRGRHCGAHLLQRYSTGSDTAPSRLGSSCLDPYGLCTLLFKALRLWWHVGANVT